MVYFIESFIAIIETAVIRSGQEPISITAPDPMLAHGIFFVVMIC